MKTKEKLEDRLIRYLLDKRGDSSKPYIEFNEADFAKIGEASWGEVLESFRKLKAEDYLEVLQIGQGHRYNVRLLDKASTYFDIKAKEKKKDVKELLATWVPIVISIISLIVSLADHFGWWLNN